jgi:hypothetical protein
MLRSDEGVIAVYRRRDSGVDEPFAASVHAVLVDAQSGAVLRGPSKVLEGDDFNSVRNWVAIGNTVVGGGGRRLFQFDSRSFAVASQMSVDVPSDDALADSFGVGVVSGKLLRYVSFFDGAGQTTLLQQFSGF